MRKRFVPVCVLVLSLWAAGVPANRSHALDTLEPFDIGVSDFEGYFSYLGAGKQEPDRGFNAEFLLGIGILNRLSGQIYGGGDSNENLTEATGSLGFGLFGTLVDTDHLDLDLGVNFTIGNLGAGGEGPAGHSQAEFTVEPCLEVNLDSDPDMNGYGLFLVVESTLGGQDNSYIPPGTPTPEEIRAFRITPGTGLLLAGYWRPAERHEILLGYDMSFNHNARAGERVTDVGGISLGYNVILADPLELITEVYFDIPQDDENFGVDVMVGFIATLPSLVP
jgi:hypothetical protein